MDTISIQLLGQIVFISLILYLAYQYLFSKSDQYNFNRFYLLSALIVSIIIPIINIPVYPYYISLNTEAVIPSNSSQIQTESTMLAWNWIHLLIAVYSIGFIVRALLFIKRLITIHKIVRHNDVVKMGDFTKVYCPDSIPLSSFLNWIFIPISKKENLSNYELSHELAHINQKHSWDILFIELYQIIFWFNPFVFYYKKRLIETHEYLADQTTIKLHGKMPYEGFLIKQIQTLNPIHITNNFASLFKERINMMNSTYKANFSSYILVLITLFISLSLFSFKSYPVLIDNHTSSSLSVLDTIPRQDTIIVHDTVVVYDPNTFSEKITITSTKVPVSSMLDTLVVFDTETKQEQIIEFNRITNEERVLMDNSIPAGIDTIVIFDSETFKETVITINNATGKRDTIR
ncbi:hypothetical protein N9231_02555 [Saprospiraceae bacterium]|nr:hypothetical protein [Saprospiraceae bacterium]